MAGPRKSILAMGLRETSSESQTQWNAAQIMSMVEAQMKELNDAGIDMKSILLDEDDTIPVSVSKVRERLREQAWDGVSIGYGVRSNKKYTQLFEELVNVVVKEGKPTPTFMFANGPGHIAEGVKRAFPQNFEGTS